jgi:hypothetical protein
MKSILKIISLSFFLANCHLCFSQCPKGGKTKSGAPTDEETSAFNKRKNKSSQEPDKEPKAISLSAIKSGKTKKDDRGAWYEGAYVEMTGAYLVDYKQQGGESCNCYEAEDDKSKGDIHINVATKEDMNAGNNNYYVVIEITPSYKKLHPDFLEELKALKGKKVVVRGYLFYDSEHEHNSINYCETCSDIGVWRKTCWEVHPVTYIAAAD